MDYIPVLIRVRIKERFNIEFCPPAGTNNGCGKQKRTSNYDTLL
jgi:hypothetical protein